MATKIIRGASSDDKRAILKGNKGQAFSVEWTTRKGERTKRNLREWTEGALTYGSHNVQPNPMRFDRDLFTAADTAKLAAENPFPWVNIELRNLHTVVMGGTTYVFEG